MSKIKSITAREILNGKGNPSVEATVTLQDGSVGIASSPAGTSIGSYEAAELRDNDPLRYKGKGVLKAVNVIQTILAPKLIDMEVTRQREIDKLMIDLDGTQNKSHLGANTLLAISMSVAKAAAASKNMQLYEYLHELIGSRLPLRVPIPLFNVINGGAHAINTFNFQEFLLVPASFQTYANALEMGSMLYHTLYDFLATNGLSTLVGDEGGFAPQMSTNYDGLSVLSQVIETTNKRLGFDIFLGIDAASQYFYRNQSYHMKAKTSPLSHKDLLQVYKGYIAEFHMLYLEDGFAEDDWDGWTDAVATLGKEALIVGDDLIATNPYRLQMAIDKRAITGVVIKPNQIGTVIESLAVVEVAREAGLKVIVSHRSGETNDDFVADFAVAVSADYAKFGAPARGERVAKYNRLLKIEQELAAKQSK